MVLIVFALPLQKKLKTVRVDIYLSIHKNATFYCQRNVAIFLLFSLLQTILNPRESIMGIVIHSLSSCGNERLLFDGQYQQQQ